MHLAVTSGPPLIRRRPLAALRVGRNEHAVDVKLKQLLFVGPHSGGKGRGDDRGLQVRGRLDGLCSTPDEELVVDVLWGERMKGEAGIAPEIGALG